MAHQASVSITYSWNVFSLMSIELVMPSNHLILCHPLLLLFSVFSSIRSFLRSLRIRWPKYWSFSFSISPSKDYAGLIAFRIDWFDLLASPRNSPDLQFLLEGTQWPYMEKAMAPTPVLSPGKSHGRRSLVGCSPCGYKELDMTEQLHFHFLPPCTGEGNGNPLQCSCLEDPRDGGAWWAAIYGVAQSRTRLK